MAIVWYGLIVLAVGLVLDQAAIGSSTAVTAEANARIYGEAGGTLLLVAGLAGIITSWNAFILGGSRAIYTESSKHCLLLYISKIV
jgi:basic amino acid/polyamine antiporter, APA family